MSKAAEFDPVWEQKYGAGHAERYPWDSVVSFVFRHAPRHKQRKDTRILEVGFGTGSNLWFAAREGFSVAGVEMSPSGVAYAKERFAAEGLAGDLRAGDFTRLPFADHHFDLVIDREALCCAGRNGMVKAISEIHRVLRVGGRFFFNCYADSHSSYRAGERGDDGLTVNISGGSLVGCGQLQFISRSDIDLLFGKGWRLGAVERLESVDMLQPAGMVHAEWKVVAEKLP